MPSGHYTPVLPGMGNGHPVLGKGRNTVAFHFRSWRYRRQPEGIRLGEAQVVASRQQTLLRYSHICSEARLKSQIYSRLHLFSCIPIPVYTTITDSCAVFSQIVNSGLSK